MRKLTILMAALALVMAGSAFAVITGSGHDLSTSTANPGAWSTDIDRICVFCHTPHMIDANPPNGQYPLWNQEFTTVTSYGTYDSATFDATGDITDIAGGAPGTYGVSMLCMSCHDGTVAIGSTFNDPNETGANPTMAGANLLAGQIIPAAGSYIGTDLTNDHPVNFSYAVSDATDVEIVAAAGLPAWALDGAGDVQCSSCHDVHNMGTGTYALLQIDNTGSALCLTCHMK